MEDTNISFFGNTCPDAPSITPWKKYLQVLQNIHDEYGTDKWFNRLEQLAKDWGLTPQVLERFRIGT